MTWEWLGWCKPLEAEPSIDDMDRFIFKNGTTVWALGWDDAVARLESISTRDFWASETEPGTWVVQFEARDDPRIIVTVRGVESGAEAARRARWFLDRDAREQQLIGY